MRKQHQAKPPCAEMTLRGRRHATSARFVQLERLDFLRNDPDRRQAISFHVRTRRVVVHHELRDQVIEMLLAEDDELVQTLPAYSPNKPFTSAVQIRRSFRQAIRLHASILDRHGEVLREFHVPIVKDHFGFLLAILRLRDKPLGLLAHPGRVWMLGGLSDDCLACR